MRGRVREIENEREGEGEGKGEGEGEGEGEGDRYECLDGPLQWWHRSSEVCACNAFAPPPTLASRNLTAYKSTGSGIGLGINVDSTGQLHLGVSFTKNVEP